MLGVFCIGLGKDDIGIFDKHVPVMRMLCVPVPRYVRTKQGIVVASLLEKDVGLFVCGNSCDRLIVGMPEKPVREWVVELEAYSGCVDSLRIFWLRLLLLVGEISETEDFGVSLHQPMKLLYE